MSNLFFFNSSPRGGAPVFTFRGMVADRASLPITVPVGDAYFVMSEQVLLGWDGSNWTPVDNDGNPSDVAGTDSVARDAAAAAAALAQQAFRRFDVKLFGAGLPASGSTATVQELIDAGRYADLDTLNAAYGLTGSAAIARSDMTAAEIFASCQVPLVAESTQAWAAIQAALDAAGYAVIASNFKVRATVHVPDGEWIIDRPLQIPSFVHLRGESQRGTIIRYTGPDGRPCVCSYNAEDGMILNNWFSYLHAKRRTPGGSPSVKEIAARDRYRVLGVGFHWPAVHADCGLDELTIEGGADSGQFNTQHSGTVYTDAEYPGVVLLGSNFKIGSICIHKIRGPGLYLRGLILNSVGSGELEDHVETGVTDSEGFPPSYDPVKKALYARNSHVPDFFLEASALPSETMIGNIDIRTVYSFGAFIQANDGVCGTAQISDIRHGGWVPLAPPEVEAAHPHYMAMAHRTAAVRDPKTGDRQEYSWNEGVGMILGCTGQRWDQIHIFGAIGGAMLWVSPDQQFHINFLEVDDFGIPFTGTPRVQGPDGRYTGVGSDGNAANYNGVTAKARFGILCDALENGRTINQLFVSNYFGLKVNQNRKQFGWHASNWPSDGSPVRVDYAGVIGAVNGGVDIGAVRMIETPGMVLSAGASNVTLTYKGETGQTRNSGEYSHTEVVAAIAAAPTQADPAQAALSNAAADALFRRSVGTALIYLDLGEGEASWQRNHDLTLNAQSLPEYAIHMIGRGSVSGSTFRLTGTPVLEAVYWADGNNSGGSKMNMCRFEGSIALTPEYGLLGSSSTGSNLSNFIDNFYDDNDLSSLTMRRANNGDRMHGGPSEVEALKASGRLHASSLASVTHPINTLGKYAGKRVWDITNRREMLATGRAPTDAWTDAIGGNAITPA